jgi:NAD(P)H-flavin reductase
MYRYVLSDLVAMGMLESDIYVSLERKMKCGIGKCGHCQINGTYVCQDGPVFTYAQVRNLPEALQ